MIMFFRSFGLDRKGKVSSPPVYSHVYLICFDLAHRLNKSSQVILQGIAGDAREYVDEAVIAEYCEESLLVVQSIHADDPWGGISRIFVSEREGFGWM